MYEDSSDGSDQENDEQSSSSEVESSSNEIKLKRVEQVQNPPKSSKSVITPLKTVSKSVVSPQK